MGRDFSLAVAEVLEANGFTALLCDRDTPTPVISHTIRVRKALGGINMTASHNPAEYQGLKYSLHNGAPASLEVTQKIEAHIAKRQTKNWQFQGSVIGTYTCKEIDPMPAYFKRIRQLVDFKAIQKAKLKIAVELMYGAGRGYLDTLLEDAGVKVTRFTIFRTPLRRSTAEPNAEGMTEAAACVAAGKAQFALGLDGDADRFGWWTRTARGSRPIKSSRSPCITKEKPPLDRRCRAHRAHQPYDRCHCRASRCRCTKLLWASNTSAHSWRANRSLSVARKVAAQRQRARARKGRHLACLLMAELVAVERKPSAKFSSNWRNTSVNSTPTASTSTSIPRKKPLCSIDWRRVWTRSHHSRAGVYHHRRLQISPTQRRMGCLPASGTEPVVRCYLETKSAARMKTLKSACRKILK